MLHSIITRQYKEQLETIRLNDLTTGTYQFDYAGGWTTGHVKSIGDDSVVVDIPLGGKRTFSKNEFIGFNPVKLNS